jgi:hypothetical protein
VAFVNIARLLGFPDADLSAWIFLIYQGSENFSARCEFAQQLQPFRHHCRAKGGDAGKISAGPVEALYDPKADWILAHVKDDRGRRDG